VGLDAAQSTASNVDFVGSGFGQAPGGRHRRPKVHLASLMRWSDDWQVFKLKSLLN
jgi:hypothetical protein